MYPFQNRILPLVKSQTLIDPTPNNFRDVSLCVAIAAGWRFIENASGIFHVIKPDGMLLTTGETGILHVSHDLYNRGVIPHYASEMNIIALVIEKQFAPAYEISHVRVKATGMITVSFRLPKTPMWVFRGRAAPEYPALAWAVAYLHSTLEE